MNIIRKLESLVHFAVFDAKILMVEDPSKRPEGTCTYHHQQIFTF
jgi:hypothetical protein